MEPRRFGWHPGLPDMDAPQFGSRVSTLAALPPSVDLRGQDSAIYDQGNLGNCTGNAIAGMCQFVLRKLGKPAFVPSRLFIYWNERLIENSINADAGASLSDGIRVISRLGVPNEKLWWYNIGKFKVKPNLAVFNDAAKHKAEDFLGLDNTDINQLKTCLSLGFPFVFGSTIFPGINTPEAAATGVIPMPLKGQPILGGHAMMCLGYSDDRGCFIMRNSWGAGWGEKGYAYMPYAYITSRTFTQDVWTTHLVN